MEATLLLTSCLPVLYDKSVEITDMMTLESRVKSHFSFFKVDVSSLLPDS